jgi:hypothetical protein
VDHSHRSWNRVAPEDTIRALAPAAVILAGAFGSRALLTFAPARYHVDLAQPLPVATNWGAYGALLWLVLAATLSSAFILARRPERQPPSQTLPLWTCGLALIAGSAWLPLFSSDVYAYAAYGEMARLGMNPYLHLTHASTDPVLAAAQWQWSGAYPICVYGEAFVELARAAVSLTGAAHVALTLAVLRVISGCSLIACVVSAYALSPRAAWFLATNPIAIWAAIEGHNDTTALAVVLGGVVLARRSTFAGSATIAAAALVKLPALGAAAALLVDAWIARERVLPVVAGTLLGTGLAVAGSLVLISGIRADLAPHGHYQPLASVQSLGIPIAILAAAAIVWRVRSFNHRIDRWCVLSLAAWIAIPNPYPWYALWLLAPAGFAYDVRVRTAVLMVSAAALLRYLPDAAAFPGTWPSLALGSCALAAFVPLFGRSKPVL